MNYNRPLLDFGRRCKLPRLYSLLRKLTKGHWVTIIVYHRVDEAAASPWTLPAINPHDFEEEMLFLKQHTDVVSLDELFLYMREQRRLSRNLSAITFDDGFRDNYCHAFPILRKFALPATIFLATDRIGNPDLALSDQVNYAVWNTALSQVRIEGLGEFILTKTHERKAAARTINMLIKSERLEIQDQLVRACLNTLQTAIPTHLNSKLMLSWSEINEMTSSNITFGAHTCSHRRLAGLTKEDARREIIESKLIIEKKTGKKVTAFAYPFGTSADYNETTVRLVREAGFIGAVTLNHGVIDSWDRKVSPFELPRISGTRVDRFEWNLSGLLSDLRA